jgi:2-polyprenyl-3-methyl-5-hydroxy-6-metoxy-1,4-benzoquinol methylase
MSLSSNPGKADQHIYVSREQLAEIEQKVRIARHVERYALLRQFARGVVCDAACGCGYGSYLLASNPDVEFVVGLDADPKIISFAQAEYTTEKTRFEAANLEDYILPDKVDMLISVETVEHLENKSTLPDFVDRNCINHVILTYPSKKTTHYNKYHVYDFNLQDVLDMFDKFTCYRHFNWEYEFDVVFLIRNP